MSDRRTREARRPRAYAIVAAAAFAAAATSLGWLWLAGGR